MRQNWNRYCFNIVIAVVTRGGRPVDKECRVMLEEIMLVVLHIYNDLLRVSEVVVIGEMRREMDKFTIQYLLPYQHHSIGYVQR